VLPTITSCINHLLLQHLHRPRWAHLGSHIRHKPRRQAMVVAVPPRVDTEVNLRVLQAGLAFPRAKRLQRRCLLARTPQSG